MGEHRSVRSPRAAAALVALLVAMLGVVAIWSASPARADGPTTFSNTTALAVPATGSANQIGPAAPYPSPIAVSGMAGNVSEVQVTLTSATHSTGGDLDVLLVAPTGESLILLSDAGDPSTLTILNGATLTFADGAPAVPQTGVIATGTYRPTNTGGDDVFPAPASTPSTTTTFAGAFSGIGANGTWNLYVVDDATGDIGSIAGGWSLTLTTTATAAPTTTTLSGSPNPSRTGDPVTFTATVTSAGSPVTAGTVAFSIGGTPVGSSIPVNASGQAMLTTSTLPEGTHSLSAVYSGATGFLTSTGSVTQVVDNDTTVVGNSFCNTGQITIPLNGRASVYPSRVFVTGLAGRVLDAELTLFGVSHSEARDLDVMLAGPDPTDNLIVLSDIPGAPSGATITIADGAPPFSTLAGSVTGSATNLGDGADTIPAPAPTPSSATTFADAFGESTANGAWTLYVLDDATGDSGSISGGWCLQLTTGVATTTTLDADAAVATGDDVEVTASVTAEGEPVTSGSVVFEVDGVATGPVAVSDGGASTTIASIARGAHTVEAEYTGGDGYGDSSATPITVTATSATTLTLSAPEIVAAGADVTLTATIDANDGPVDAGSVSYTLDGGTPVTVPGTPVGGQVSFVIAELARGSHTIAATYDGDDGWADSSAEEIRVLAQQATTLTLSTAPVIEVGEDAVVTAAVTEPGGAPVTVGSVSYAVDGGTPVPAGSLDADGGVAVVITGLTRGTHTIDATYTGVDGYTDSVAIQIQVLAESATVTTIATPAAVGAGDSFDIEIAVRTTADEAVDAGTVSYAVDGGPAQPAGTPVDGVVTVTVPGQTRGTHTLTASYTGADGYRSSTADPVDVVAVEPTAITITVTPAAPRAHETFAVTVALTGGGAAVTEGVVAVTIDGDQTEIDAADLPGASLDVTPTSTETITLTAAFPGTADYAPSDQTLQVTPAAMPTALVLTAPASATEGDLVDLVAAVSADNPAVTATGAVTFAVDGAQIGTVPLAGGTATLATDELGAGARELTATYVADAGFDESAGSAGIDIAPVAQANGPYEIAEGEPLTLAAAGSSAGTEIGWDLDGDGDFGDAAGDEVTLAWVELETLGIDDGPATHEIAVQASVNGLTATATTTLEVSNTGPEVIIDGASSAVVGEALTLKLSADDPSGADMAALFTYVVDWGDGTPVVEVEGPADPPVTHTYTEAGDVEATFSVRDRDGATGGSMTITIAVEPAQQPTNPSDGGTSSGSGSGGLPSTGVDAAGIAAAVTLLVAGVGVLVARGRMVRQPR